jgi:hypothetical protein
VHLAVRGYNGTILALVPAKTARHTYFFFKVLLRNITLDILGVLLVPPTKAGTPHTNAYFFHTFFL